DILLLAVLLVVEMESCDVVDDDSVAFFDARSTTLSIGIVAARANLDDSALYEADCLVSFGNVDSLYLNLLWNFDCDLVVYDDHSFSPVLISNIKYRTIVR